MAITTDQNSANPLQRKIKTDADIRPPTAVVFKTRRGFFDSARSTPAINNAGIIAIGYDAISHANRSTLDGMPFETTSGALKTSIPRGGKRAAKIRKRFMLPWSVLEGILFNF